MKSRVPIILSLCVLAFAVVAKREDFGVVQHFQLQVFDAFMRRHPRSYTQQPVKIIDIDEESLRRLGQWPWPRTRLAELTEKLHAMGAAAIAWDVVFAEQDRNSPEQVLGEWGKVQELGYLLDQLPDPDATFAAALKDAHAVSSFVLLEETRPALPKIKAGYSFAGADPHGFLMHFNGATVTLPALEAASAGNGALNSFPDRDGIIRRMPLAAVIGTQFYPTLSAEALRVAQGASTYIIKSAGASGEEDFGARTGIAAVKVGRLEIPTDAEGSFWIYYTPYVAERYIPAWKVLEPDFDAAQIQGNILLVGTSAAGLKDIRATPLDPAANGVEVHAQAIEQVLSSEFLKRPDWLAGAEDMLMVAVGLVLIVMMLKLPALWGALFTAGTLGLAGFASWQAFLKYHLLVDPVTPGIAIILLYLSGSLSKFAATERERSHIRRAFSQYMSPELLAQLSSHPEQLKLGGETKELTILFCDIRGFTSVSETMEAQALTVFINQYLTPMTEVILRRRGTIDKYMGDCIMAFWNAPLDDEDHARHAADAALAMLQALAEFNEGRKTPLSVGIGLNTGLCCVGNMGSDQRFDYSVLGDDVNLASRLEGQSKTYGVPILIGEATQAQLTGYATLELDLLRVKGKRRAVRVFALLGGEELAQDASFLKFREVFAEMLAAYLGKSWKKAEAKLKECVKLSKNIPADLETLLQLYRERFVLYRASPPPKNWDGIYEAADK